MLDHSLFFLVFASAIGSFMVSGVFFGFSSFITKGLGRIPEQAGIEAMNSINVTVINLGFMLALFGTVIVSLLSIVAAFVAASPQAWLTMLAGLLYVLGCAGVTMAFNVPLNNALAKVVFGTTEATALWARYLKEWTFWNSVRTAASLAAGILFVMVIAGWGA